MIKLSPCIDYYYEVVKYNLAFHTSRKHGFPPCLLLWFFFCTWIVTSVSEYALIWDVRYKCSVSLFLGNLWAPFSLNFQCVFISEKFWFFLYFKCFIFLTLLKISIMHVKYMLFFKSIIPSIIIYISFSFSLFFFFLFHSDTHPHNYVWTSNFSTYNGCLFSALAF